VVLGGAYQLVGRIGEGGMGVVYEAHHLRLQKRVAVKLMNLANASHQDALERFRREAMVASRLGHPHLVNVIDFGASDDGQPYLVMEFLEGENLDVRIHRAGPVPLQGAIRILRQTASAVAAVHVKGIVHRDLKPANIFLVHVSGEPDFVKVLDFGVSKIRAVRTKLTDASKTVGTPEYMSPEQVVGSSDEVDHRADQWALACIVWEMLSGAPPFSADDPDALFYQLRNLPPQPLTARVPDLAPGVEAVLLRALSKRPADRYSSIREFARALESAALGQWAEITPIESNPTTIGFLPRLSKLRDSFSATVGLPVRVADDGNRRWLWPRATRKRFALSTLAAATLALAAVQLVTGGRSKAVGAVPALQPASASAPIAPPRTMPAPAVTELPDGVEPPPASPSKEKMIRTKAGVRRLAGGTKPAAGKHGGAHPRSTAKDKAAGGPSRRLTVEDF
jgi:eukaryotic-like serine/threonine-protein kinase